MIWQFIRRQDDTFIYWNDASLHRARQHFLLLVWYKCYIPHPPGDGVFFSEIPLGGGYFLDLGYDISICYERENDIINSEAISCTNDDDDNEEDDDGVIWDLSCFRQNRTNHQEIKWPKSFQYCNRCRITFNLIIMLQSEP